MVELYFCSENAPVQHGIIKIIKRAFDALNERPTFKPSMAKFLLGPHTSRVQRFKEMTNACGDLIEIAVVTFIVTTAIARGGSWCTRNERSVLTTFATGHDGCCINSWAAELAKVG
ncbi:hypothetical protein BELL_0087g00080 [Botrytis elliptica]|uniref:Uncharacterized protein n=1 Tax=Botrytis elliptica TaxID=278938 RepID=A0A4Z1K9C0_9HELO|nr:hypothetical protein BELL_0087g00080 [Botrytis elliptica]